MLRLALALVTTTVLLTGPARTQGLDLAGMTSDAASALTDAARDRLLVADLIGAEITDPAGRAGTVTNLVAVPGGRLVAVLVEPSGGGEPIALPYQILKLDTASDTLGVSLERRLSELAGMQGITELGQAMGGLLSEGD